MQFLSDLSHMTDDAVDDSENSKSSSSATTTQGSIRIDGFLTCRAAASASSSFQDAIDSLKKDAARSLLHRFSVAVDDLQTNGINLSIKSQFTLPLPKRVYLNAEIPFSDFVTAQEDEAARCLIFQKKFLHFFSDVNLFL